MTHTTFGPPVVILRSFSILQITSFKSVTSVPQSYILCRLIELLNRTCVGSGLSCDSKIIFYKETNHEFEERDICPTVLYLMSSVSLTAALVFERVLKEKS